MSGHLPEAPLASGRACAPPDAHRLPAILAACVLLHGLVLEPEGFLTASPRKGDQTSADPPWMQASAP